MGEGMKMISARACTAVLVGLVLGFAGALAGCSPPTVDSPFDGKPVTGDQLLAQVAKAEAQAAKDDAADKAKAEAAVRTAKAKAEAEVRRIAAQTKVDQANREVQLADTVAAAAVNTEQVMAEFAAARVTRQSALEALKAQSDDAFANLEAQMAQRSAIAKFAGSIPVVSQYAGAAGVDTQALAGLLIGAGGMAWQASRSKKHADASWDEATAKQKADADAQRARADALQAQLLALMVPPPTVAAVAAAGQGVGAAALN
jgi:hypothetical protein